MKRCNVTVFLECFQEADLLHSILREVLMRVRCRRGRGRRRRVGTPSGALEREDVLGRRRRRMVACLWRRSCAGHSTHQLQMVLHPSRVDLEDEALQTERHCVATPTPRHRVFFKRVSRLGEGGRVATGSREDGCKPDRSYGFIALTP